MLNAPRDTTRRPSPALNIAATVMLVLLLVLLAWRITFQGSLWCDEIYTIVLVHHPVDVLIDKTTVDAHPPTYYLMLKAWNRIGRLIGIDPGIGWGRTPGLALWLVLAGVAWWVGRRVPGRAYAGLLALAVACGAQLAWGVSNMRSYATAAPAAGICILLMLHLSTGKGRRAALRRTWPLWTGYALAAALLLWSHLLGAYLLLPLGLCGSGLRAGRCTWRGCADCARRSSSAAPPHSRSHCSFSFPGWCNSCRSSAASPAGAATG